MLLSRAVSQIAHIFEYAYVKCTVYSITVSNETLTRITITFHNCSQVIFNYSSTVIINHHLICFKSSLYVANMVTFERKKCSVFQTDFFFYLHTFTYRLAWQQSMGRCHNFQVLLLKSITIDKILEGEFPVSCSGNFLGLGLKFWGLDFASIPGETRSTQTWLRFNVDAYTKDYRLDSDSSYCDLTTTLL